MNSTGPAATKAGASPEHEPRGKSSRKFSTAFVLILTTIAVGTLGWYGLRQVGQSSRDAIVDELNASLKPSQVAVEQWLDNQREMVERWLAIPEVRQDVIVQPQGGD